MFCDKAFNVSVSIRLISNNSGQLPALLLFGRDITEAECLTDVEFSELMITPQDLINPGLTRGSESAWGELGYWQVDWERFT